MLLRYCLGENSFGKRDGTLVARRERCTYSRRRLTCDVAAVVHADDESPAWNVVVGGGEGLDAGAYTGGLGSVGSGKQSPWRETSCGGGLTVVVVVVVVVVDGLVNSSSSTSLDKLTGS